MWLLVLSLSPPFDSHFSPPDHLCFLPPRSPLNPILWISVGVLGCGEHLGNIPTSKSFPWWVGSSHQVAKVSELQLQHQSFQWIFRFDFFRIDRFDLLAVQGTLKSLLQHHNWKDSILWHSAFFMVQLSCPYMTTGKTIALNVWTFVSKVISLLFNTLSIFVQRQLG